MNYALAKKLKDAGFPQQRGVDAKEILLTGRAPVYLCEHGNTHYVCPTDSSVYIPHLSELIEACVDEFELLEKIETEWGAAGKDTIGYKMGHTPEEAVARLWLELNKKTQ